MIRDAVTALLGLAYIVWGRLANLVDIDQVAANVKPIDFDRFAKAEKGWASCVTLKKSSLTATTRLCTS